MDHNNEPSSSDDDDCRLVLGPQFGRKLKRPVKLQTDCDAIKKPRNDFNDIVSYLGDNNEFEPNVPHFDAVFEISDINELLDIAPLSESWSSARFDEDQEETTCSVEDCRHNKSSVGEENNNTTTKNVNEKKKSVTFEKNEASSSKSNVPEPSTEFKVPNPVGLTKRNTRKKKGQRGAPANQSKTPQNQNVLHTKHTENSAPNGINLLELATSSSSASFKSSQSNSSSSKKSVPSIQTISSNSSKKSENNSSKKSSNSNKSSSSGNAVPLNNSNQVQNKTSKKSKKKKASKNSNASSESGNTKNSKATSSESNRSNATSLESNKSKGTTSESNKSIAISSKSSKSNATSSESNKSKATSLESNKSKGKSSESNKSNATSSGSNKFMGTSSESDKSNATSLGCDKSMATSSSVDLIVISSDDAEPESNINKITTAMLANAVAEAEVKVMNEKLNKSVKKLTIGFVKLFTKNAEDIDILGENDDTFTASGRFEVENKIKKRTNPDGTTELELHMTILTTIFSSVPSQSSYRTNHQEKENLNNDQKTSNKISNNSKINKDFNNDVKKNDGNKNNQKSDNSNKINNNTTKNGKIRKNNKRRKNMNRKVTEAKGQKINEQQNNNQKPKQDNNNGKNKFVDPNQPSTSKNYDPSCVLVVPSTSKCSNLHLKQNVGSGPSRVRENEMDVDSSNGTENPVVEQENLTVEDLAVPGCSNEFVKAEQRQAFKQIRTAVGAWIKQCIDNVPIQRPAQEKEIMHEKVLRALSKKLRLLYNNCYDILRNKKIQIIVPVSEDPNSDKFKPIITLSANNSVQNLMLNISDTTGEASVLERDLAVSSDTDVADTEQPRPRNKEAQNVENDTIVISDDERSSSQSFNCDIESTSEEDSTLEDDVLDIIKMPNSNDENSGQNVNKKDQNENINNVEVIEENNGSSSKSDSEKLNASKPEYDTDQISSLSEYFGERNNSEGNDGSEENNSYEADIDDLNSSVNEKEDDVPNQINNEDSSSSIYYKRKVSHCDDKCKSQPSSHNKENKNQGDNTSSENDSEDDDDNNDHNSGEKNAISMEVSNESSSEDHQTVSGQCANVNDTGVQNELNDCDRLLQGNIGRTNVGPLQPSQVIQGPYESVSNHSDVLINAHFERIREIMNSRSNICANVSNERDENCTDNNPITVNDHVCCLPRRIGDVIQFAANGGLGSILATTTPIRPIENTLQTPTTEIQDGRTHSENSPQMYSFNSSSIPTTTSSITFNQSPIIPFSPNIEVSRTSCLPSQENCNPQLMNYQSTSNDLFRNDASPAHQDSARVTISTQTPPVTQLNSNSNPELQQSNGPITETTSQDGTEWALSDSESSDSNSTDRNETVSHTTGSTNPIAELPLENYHQLIDDHRFQLMHHIEELRARQVAFQQSTMRDSHRNLWLRQQHQLETMRRHAVRSPADRPVTRSISQARRNHGTAAASNSTSSRTVRPRQFRFLVPRDPSQSQILDLRRRPRQQRNRSNNIQTTPQTFASLQSLIQVRPPISNPPPRSEVLDPNRYLGASFMPIPVAEQQARNVQQILRSPIVIEDDDGNHEASSVAPEAIDYSFAMENYNPGRLFFANIERNPSMRRINTDLIINAIQRIVTNQDHNHDEEDVEDEEYRAANAMPLQELVDNTTVVFQYDGLTQEERCNICLCDYVRDETLRRLPCFHTYHRNCIDQWLSRERRTCPNCRMYLSSHLCYAHNNSYQIE